MKRLVHTFRKELKEASGRSDALTPAEQEALIRGYDAALDGERPPRLVLIGESGVGKSTTVNALFNAGQPVGHTRATTDHAYAVQVEEVSGRRGVLEVVDMPGIGDDLTNYRRYLDLYLRVLPTADAIVWVHAAEDRSVHLVQQALLDLLGQSGPDLSERLVLALNKADEIDPHDWNRSANLPSARQLEALRERAADFTEKIVRVLPAWQGGAVTYSARQHYNLTALFKEMMQAVPQQRRWVLERRMDLADFTAKVDRKLLKAASARMLAEVRPQAAVEAAQAAAPATGARLSEALAALPEAKWRELTQDRALFLAFTRRVEQESGR
ncbi:GTPase [Streptomyces sp. AP-93]|uniref:GTPase family protein n=1 Tax=Streptomyces sp. AP-93 TaxID=2929048 RepID=UPI001FAEF7B6|nr:GTPase [Streptomyces sp. AP-93]MCJ0872070.1 50S ribosome-binding GTPase [Streptomyces sp. AP-93]